MIAVTRLSQLSRVAALGSAVITAIGFHSMPAAEPAAKWFKGNTHAHSLWSDGDDFPEMIVDWYRKNGYQFLGLSDHNILSEGEKWMKVRTWRPDGRL